MASIFTGDGPAQSFDDGTTLELGMVWRSAVDAHWVGVRVWGPPTSPGSVVVSAWRVTSDVTGELLASQPASVPLAPAVWNDVLFDAPVDVVAGAYYCAQYQTDSHYTAEVGRFISGEVTNGDLTAVQHSVEPPDDPLANGRFLAGSGFAAGNGNGAWYGVDVLVSAGVGTPQGASGVDVGLEVAAAGGRVSRGAGGHGLRLDVSVAGGTRSAGVVDAGLVLAVQAAGRRPSRGAAGVELEFGVDARSGRAVVMRPSTGVVVRPSTGVVVRPSTGVVTRP